MLQPLLVSHYQQVYSKPVCWHHRHIIPLVTLHTHTRMTTLGPCECYLGKENVTRLFSDSKPSSFKKKSSLLANLANNKFRCQNGLLKNALNNLSIHKKNSVLWM